MGERFRPFSVAGVGNDPAGALDSKRIRRRAARMDDGIRGHDERPERGRLAGLQLNVVDREVLLHARGSGEQDLLSLTDSRLEARRAGDHERPGSLGHQPRFQDEERDASEVVPVQMGDEDCVDARWRHAPTLHADERGGAAVEKEPRVPGINEETGLQPASAPEGVTAAEKVNADRHRVATFGHLETISLALLVPVAISVASLRSRSSEPLNVYRIRLGVPPPSGLDLLASRHGTSRWQNQSLTETSRLLANKQSSSAARFLGSGARRGER